jgi:hypothetical protein
VHAEGRLSAFGTLVESIAAARSFHRRIGDTFVNGH